MKAIRLITFWTESVCDGFALSRGWADRKLCYFSLGSHVTGRDQRFSHIGRSFDHGEMRLTGALTPSEIAPFEILDADQLTGSLAGRNRRSKAFSGWSIKGCRSSAFLYIGEYFERTVGGWCYLDGLGLIERVHVLGDHVFVALELLHDRFHLLDLRVLLL